MFYYTSLCFFKLLCSFKCNCVFYCFSTLTLSTVSSVMTLFPAIYASSIFELLFLLQRLLKHLLLLEFIVWPFLFWFLSIKFLISGFLRLLVVLYTLRLLCFAKIHWFWFSVLLFQCLLWCLLHWCLPNVTLVGLLSLVDPVVDFNYFVD